MAKLKHFILLFAILLAAACDPCEELGNAICDCETSAEAQQECKRQLYARKRHPHQDQDPELCKKALESCSCEALRRNEVEKCGMTRNRKTN